MQIITALAPAGQYSIGADIRMADLLFHPDFSVFYGVWLRARRLTAKLVM